MCLAFQLILLTMRLTLIWQGAAVLKQLVHVIGKLGSLGTVLLQTISRAILCGCSVWWQPVPNLQL